MNRGFVFAPDEFYHIYNRGTEKRNIFLGKHDKDRFIKLLYLCNSKQSLNMRELPEGPTFEIDRGETVVNIGAYCLMSNHFHLLLHEKEDGGISYFMKKLATAYSMFFNTKYKRSGTLFQGRFKAKHLSEDIYLKHIFAYIHLNPVDLIEPSWKERGGVTDISKTINYLKNYNYSSYSDYLDLPRPESVIISRAVFPGYFEDARDINLLMKDWLQRTDLWEKHE